MVEGGAMRFSAFITVLIGIMFIPGALAANSATIDFKSPSEAVMTLEATISGEQAADMREYMDYSGQGGAGGNGDGTVQQNEVDAVETFFKGFFEQDGEDSSPAGSFTIDDKAPSDFELSEFDIRDATGAVSSTSPITMFMEFTIKFDITAGDRHTVRIEAEEGDDEDNDNPAGDFEIEDATLKAPKGYVIESATGLPEGASVSGDKKSIHYNGLPSSQDEDTVIVFQKSGGGSPGFGFTLGLLGTVAVVAVLAARRGRN
jgi:hypothetical protein